MRAKILPLKLVELMLLINLDLKWIYQDDVNAKAYGVQQNT